MAHSSSDGPGRIVPTGGRPAGALRLLVIDDEALLLRSVVRMLRGYTVVTANSVAEALTLLDSESFDLILCDLVMPEQGGADFHRILVDSRPELLSRLVFSTGGVFSEPVRRFVESVDVPILEKPFTGEELAAMVAAVSG